MAIPVLVRRLLRLRLSTGRHLSRDRVPEANFAETDAAMAAWQQGDVIDGGVFVHVGQQRTGEAIIRRKSLGLVVISQTCDIVAKSSETAPYVNVAELVELAGTKAKEAAAGDRPRYAVVPALGDKHFADLDSVMTVEKSLLVGKPHRRGVRDDAEEAQFGAAVGRKFSRFAFPDSLNDVLKPLQDRFKNRHDKPNSPEGVVLGLVRHIRVAADPDWKDREIDVTVIFVLDPGVLTRFEDPPPISRELGVWLKAKQRGAPDLADRLATRPSAEDGVFLWETLADAWVAMCEPGGPIRSVSAEILGADEFTLDRYWSSYRLDLDYLSGSTPAD